MSRVSPSLPSRRRAEEFARALESGAVSTDPTLVPLTTVAHALQSLPTDGAPSEEFRAALRTRLVAVATVQAAAPPAPAPGAVDRVREWSQGWRGQRRFAVATGTIAAMIAVAGVGVGAARSLPGDPFYGIKRGTEAAQMWATTGTADRGRKHLSLARARLDEISRLVQEGTALGPAAPGQPLAAGVLPTSLSGELRDTLADMDDETRAGSRDLTRAYARSRDRGLLRTLQTFAVSQRQSLSSLLPAFPAGAVERAQQSLALLEQVEQRANDLLAVGVCSSTCTSPRIQPGSEDGLGVLPCECVVSPPGTSTTGPQQPTTEPAPSSSSSSLPPPGSTGDVVPLPTGSSGNGLGGNGPSIQDPTGVGGIVDKILGGSGSTTTPTPTPSPTSGGGLLPGLDSGTTGGTLPLPSTTSDTSSTIPLPLPSTTSDTSSTIPLPDVSSVVSGTGLLP